MKKLTSIIAVTLGIFLNTAGRAADNSAGSEPVQSAFEHYLKIQSALAKDSIKGVDEHANAIAKAVRDDETKTLSMDVAKQADALAAAKNIKAAREAFKPLSASLVKYRADHKINGPYREAYCPMAKASWLQTEKDIRNPYFGKEMLDCGDFKN